MASRKSVVFKITMDVYAKTTEAKVRVSSNDAFPICQLSFDAFPFSSEDTKFFIRQPQNQSRFTKLFFAFPKFDFWSFNPNWLQDDLRSFVWDFGQENNQTITLEDLEEYVIGASLHPAQVLVEWPDWNVLQSLKIAFLRRFLILC
jgi:hypothetical protein